MSGRDELICSVPRNRGAIQVRLREFKGRDLVDARQWYLDAQTGELKPSPKGVALRPEEIREVAAGLLQAAEKLEAEAG